MDLTEVRETAKEKMKGFCAVYKVCDGLPERLCQGIKYGKAIGMGGGQRGELHCKPEGFRAAEAENQSDDSPH